MTFEATYTELVSTSVARLTPALHRYLVFESRHARQVAEVCGDKSGAVVSRACVQGESRIEFEIFWAVDTEFMVTSMTRTWLRVDDGDRVKASCWCVS